MILRFNMSKSWCFNLLKGLSFADTLGTDYELAQGSRVMAQGKTFSNQTCFILTLSFYS